MKYSTKIIKEEIKRMKASMKDLQKQDTGIFKNGKFIIKTKRKPDLNLCMKCRKDTGKNFILIYKKNHELKGKMCTACHITMKEEERKKQNEKILNN